MKTEELNRSRTELDKRPYHRPTVEVFSVQMEEGIAKGSGVATSGTVNEHFGEADQSFNVDLSGQKPSDW